MYNLELEKEDDDDDDEGVKKKGNHLKGTAGLSKFRAITD